MSDVLARAAEVLVWHQRTGPSSCVCGQLPLGTSHAAHVVRVLADEGLLADVVPLREAVTVPGSHPDYHRSVMERHRREWPTLWRAIDQLIRESAPVAGGNGARSAEPCPPRPTTHETLDSLTARLVAARAATDGYRTEAERLRELLDEANAKIERMESL